MTKNKSASKKASAKTKLPLKEEKLKTLQEFTVTELKAAVYDQIAIAEQAIQKRDVINAEIARRLKVAE